MKRKRSKNFSRRLRPVSPPGLYRRAVRAVTDVKAFLATRRKRLRS